MPTRLKMSCSFIIFICLMILKADLAHSGNFTTIAMGANPPIQKVSSSRPRPLQIRRNLRKLQREVKELSRSGVDPMPVIRLIQQVPPLMRENKTREADEIIKEAFRLIEDLRSGKEVPEQQKATHDTGPYKKLVVANSPPILNGIADPSLEYGPDGTGWMTYSHVDFKKHYVSTYLAKSTDHGKTWKYVQTINQGGETNKETSTIVYDPDDPGKEWKIFYFEYVHTPKGKHLDYTNSWISYKYASKPDGTWSRGIPILTPKKNSDKGVNLATLSPVLGDFYFVNELGSIYKDGVIYLSMEGGASATGDKYLYKKKNVLLASKDHGKTWEYVGILTDNKDAKDAGYMIFTASSLVEEKGRIFLFVSPSGRLSNPQDPSGHHDGTNIYEFEDITKAKLKRDRNGKLILVKHIDHKLAKGGQADYDEENTNGGIVIPQQDKGYLPEYFQIYSTKEKIVD